MAAALPRRTVVHITPPRAVTTRKWTMTTMQISTRDQLLAAAEALTPLIEGCADQAVQDRQLPAPLVAALTEEGIFRMAIPAARGGVEVEPGTMMRVFEAIAAVDGSTGWCAMIGSANGVLAGFL